jgi:hypothetical protein
VVLCKPRSCTTRVAARRLLHSRAPTTVPTRRVSVTQDHTVHGHERQDADGKNTQDKHTHTQRPQRVRGWGGRHIRVPRIYARPACGLGRRSTPTTLPPQGPKNTDCRNPGNTGRAGSKIPRAAGWLPCEPVRPITLAAPAPQSCPTVTSVTSAPPCDDSDFVFLPHFQ